MATEKSRSGHQGTSEAGYQDVSLSGENLGPGSTEKLRQRHPSRQLGKEHSPMASFNTAGLVPTGLGWA